jgi:drug/metabolite transporter (DMT)-like permease
LTGVAFALLAGLFFGGLNITMRRGLERVGDVDAGSAVISAFAFVLVGAAALVFGRDYDARELWPFLLIGVFVPGLSQLLVIHAVRAAGASRAGILFGMAPLISALTAGVTLASVGERPVDYRAYGAALALIVAVVFGIRDNVARAFSADVASDALAQATAIMLGASVVLVGNLLCRPAAVSRFRTAFAPFALSGVVTALAQVTLFEALDRGRVTVIAPLTGTGVLWTVVFAAIFLGRSELVGRRLVIVALLVVAGGTLVGATR